MRRYWIMAPYNAEYPDIWEKVWSFDLKNGIISLGWSRLGDVSAMSEEELRSAIERTYPESKAPGYVFNTLWAFYHEISEEDLIIARRGLKKIAGVGLVAGPPYYCKDKIAEVVGPKGWAYPNHMPICWQEAPRDISFPKIVFGQQALLETAMIQTELEFLLKRITLCAREMGL